VAQYFLQKGYTKVFVIRGGWPAWLKAKYPVEDK
jgi:rhodanese-related sulfurtransferase